MFPDRKCGLGLWGTVLAFAAPTGAAVAQEGGASGALEEVVVTARLRTEELQDVPLAMAAVTGESLQRAGVEDMRALTEQFAGLQMDTSGGRFLSAPVIRGLSQVSRVDDENNVSVFIDGIYLSGRDGLDSALLDIERVEVVRGPQSALYGRNSYAGAINYITKAPSDTFTGRAGATFGSDGKLRGDLGISGPFGNSGLSYRVGLSHDEFDGTYSNGAPSSLRINGYDSDAASVALRWKATDSFEANLTGYFADDSVGPGAQQMYNGNCEFNGTKNIAYCGENPSFGSNPDFSGYDTRAFGLDRKILRTGLRLNWSFSGAELVSLTGYNSLDTRSLVDWDRSFPGLPFAIRNTTTNAVRSVNLTSIFTGGTGKIHEFSQDLRLQSNGESPLEWVVGGSYYDFQNHIRGFATVDTTPLAANEVAVSAAFLPGLFQRQGASIDPYGLPFEFSNTAKQTKNWAAYGALQYTFAETMTARAEIRYTEETKVLRQLPPPQNPNFVPLRSEDTFKYWTPRFTLDWQQSSDRLYYASVAKGAKAGGFNSAAPTPAELAFGPETNWTYEIGAKTDWLDGRFRANLAIFDIEMKDIQITNQSPNGVAVFITQNAGTGRSRGFELELVSRVTDALRVSASYSLADAKFKTARDGLLRSYPSFRTNQDVSGQPLPRQAKNLVNLAADYTKPAFAGFDGFLHLDGRYESSRDGFTHQLLGETGARTIVNGRIGLTRDNLEVSLWGKNLFNDDTPVTIGSTLTLNDNFRLPIATLPDLRSYGISGTYRF